MWLTHPSGLSTPRQETCLGNTKMGWSPLISEGGITAIINHHRKTFSLLSHAWNTAPFKSHTMLWFWQTSGRDSPIRFCWLSTSYSHTCFDALALAFVGDFAITDLWLNSHRLVTLHLQAQCAALVQTKFLAIFWKVSKMIDFLLNIFAKLYPEKLAKGTPHEPMPPRPKAKVPS